MGHRDVNLSDYTNDANGLAQYYRDEYGDTIPSGPGGSAYRGYANAVIQVAGAPDAYSQAVAQLGLAGGISLRDKARIAALIGASAADALLSEFGPNIET